MKVVTLSLMLTAESTIATVIPAIATIPPLWQRTSINLKKVFGYTFLNSEGQTASKMVYHYNSLASTAISSFNRRTQLINSAQIICAILNQDIAFFAAVHANFVQSVEIMFHMCDDS
jgi:hypothetical protein